MNRLSSLQSRVRAGVSLAVLAAALYAVCTPGLQAADPKPEKKTAKAEKKKLTGSELYAIHCARCHAERYATEWTAPQWKSIMMQMQVRANIPPSQARAILKYLQEDAGN